MDSVAAASGKPFPLQRFPALIVLCVVVLHHLAAILESRKAFTAVYIAFFAASLFLRLWPVFHLTLFMFLLRLLHPLLPGLFSNLSGVYLAILFVFSVPVILGNNATKSLLSWFRRGTIDKFAMGSIFVVSLVSAVALLLWAGWTDNLGIGEKMVQGVSQFPKPLVILIGVPAFAALNAFSEEVVYRGILQEASLRAGFRPALSIVLQASAFGALHYESGFPNGVVGYFMTLIYGTALGYLRQRSSGILVPYLTHIAADLVIAYFLCFKFL
jgi:uncharacterized protein